MSEPILLVDDDPNILSGFQRQLRKRFRIETAVGGESGLEILNQNGPFAVVISDMQMPVMDGIRFLAAVREAAPESVRMMLTGNADQKTAMDAVNDGRIFRFLTKPCSTETLTTALEAGIEQYRLVHAERELLSKTLSGSVSVLTEVLSLVNPTAFGHSASVRRLVHKICERLKVPNAWEIEIAAMLSQVGCITIPEATLANLASGAPVSEAQWRMYQDHPSVAYNLISKIPRLQGVAEIIASQQKCFDGSGAPHDGKQEDEIPLGARVLKLAIDVVQLVASGTSPSAVLGVIRSRQGWYDPRLVDVLASSLGIEYVVGSVTIVQLQEGMVLDQDVISTQGDILLTSGQDVTLSMRERLRKFAASAGGVQEPIRVRRPKRNVKGEG
jgi:response regulator RpfG family c-di-GMP phosphodiesterase